METDFVQLIHSKIETNLVMASQQAARWRHREWRTVFVHGDFEEMDSRKIYRLAEAASLGGRLIVAVHTDNLIRRRYYREPKQRQEDRALLLASMTFVSLVIYLNEEQSVELIRQLRPDVIVDFPEKVDFSEETSIHSIAQIREKINERLKIINTKSI
jgi:bifunctional ADP-heptose synthase (sugar kinase/adenylyltransferase)